MKLKKDVFTWSLPTDLPRNFSHPYKTPQITQCHLMSKNDPPSRRHHSIYIEHIMMEYCTFTKLKTNAKCPEHQQNLSATTYLTHSLIAPISSKKSNLQNKM